MPSEVFEFTINVSVNPSLDNLFSCSESKEHLQTLSHSLSGGQSVLDSLTVVQMQRSVFIHGKAWTNTPALSHMPAWPRVAKAMFSFLFIWRIISNFFCFIRKITSNVCFGQNPAVCSLHSCSFFGCLYSDLWEKNPASADKQGTGCPQVQCEPDGAGTGRVWTEVSPHARV